MEAMDVESKEIEKVEENRNTAKSVSVGVLCSYIWLKEKLGQYSFLRLYETQRGRNTAFLDRSLGFSLHYPITFPKIHCFFNDFVLLSTFNEEEKRNYYYICQPTTQLWAALPDFGIAFKHFVRSALIFDGSHFLVVCIFLITGNESLGLKIFSSETGEWKDHWPTILPPLPNIPYITSTFNFYAKPLPLFSNGAIHWNFGPCLLVYHVSDNYCKFIPLPDDAQSDDALSLPFGNCLWESQGHVHLCCSNPVGIHIWVLLHNSNYVRARDEFYWELRHCLEHKTFVSRNPSIYKSISTGGYGDNDLKELPIRTQPLAFVEASQTLYLQLPGRLVACNINTQILEEVCTYQQSTELFLCCEFHIFFYPLHSNMPPGDARLEENNLMPVVFPLADPTAKKRLVKIEDLPIMDPMKSAINGKDGWVCVDYDKVLKERIMSNEDDIDVVVPFEGLTI